MGKKVKSKGRNGKGKASTLGVLTAATPAQMAKYKSTGTLIVEGALPAGIREGRTPVVPAGPVAGERLRYLEPPRKRKGNPFIAARVPRELADHWTKWCKREGKPSASAMREALAKLSGFRGELEADADGE